LFVKILFVKSTDSLLKSTGSLQGYRLKIEMSRFYSAALAKYNLNRLEM